MNKLSLIWKTKDLRKKILMVVFLLILTRVLTHIPIPGVDSTALKSLLGGSQFLGLLDIFSGGGLANFSVAMIGVGPYITASIIMQLMTIIVPSFAELQKESGEAGRAKINQYTRWLAIPLAVLQGYSFIRFLSSPQSGTAGVLGSFTPFQWMLTLLSITAGSLLMMWLGEIISEYGIGNGISLVIFAGIIARLPFTLRQSYSVYFEGGITQDTASIVLGVAAVFVLVVAGVILVTEAQRNIPISYARQVRGDKQFGGVNTHLPLRLNQAGVIPIIFAVSMLLFPALIAQFFTSAKTPWISHAAAQVITFMNSNNQGWTYGIIYFGLVVVFTYFYTAIVFNPDEVAENVQRNGGFIPGLRPGKQTADYLYRVLNRITLPGAFFLGLIAILPLILQAFTHTQSLTIGGTSLLIVVAVVIETIKQVEGQLTMHDYQDFA